MKPQSTGEKPNIKLKYFSSKVEQMAEITIKLKVPDGMEDKVKKLVEETVMKLIQPKKLDKNVLNKYFGKYTGETREEEWYLQ